MPWSCNPSWSVVVCFSSIISLNILILILIPSASSELRWVSPQGLTHRVGYSSPSVLRKELLDLSWWIILSSEQGHPKFLFFPREILETEYPSRCVLTTIGFRRRFCGLSGAACGFSLFDRRRPLRNVLSGNIFCGWAWAASQNFSFLSQNRQPKLLNIKTS